MQEANNNKTNDAERDALSREIFSNTLPPVKEEVPAEVRLLLPSPLERKLIAVPVITILVGFLAYLIGYATLTTEIVFHADNDTVQTEGTSFANVRLEAKAAYVYDIKNDKVLYAHGENEVLPLASLTKLMMAIVASETLPRDTVVTIAANDIKTEGDTGLRVGERWKLSDIIGFTLLTSSNDGASALAAAAGSLGQHEYTIPPDEARDNFVEKMNTKASELGLRGTRFFNGTGLDVDGEISGGYGTARDVALLMAYAVRTIYDDLSITALPRATIHSLANIGHVSTNTNENVGQIPNIIASKTGYTDLAGGNLVIAFDAGLMRPIVISVLGSTREGRFEDVEKLAWAALESLKNDLPAQ